MSRQTEIIASDRRSQVGSGDRSVHRGTQVAGAGAGN
jgi:protein subunit release factor A